MAPELRHLCADFAAPQGVICDGMHLHLDADGRRAAAGAAVLSLSLVKLGEARLMAVLSDVTEQVRRERELRQTDAWLNAILTSITDYALVRLDTDGPHRVLEREHRPRHRLHAPSRRSASPTRCSTRPARPPPTTCSTACAKPTRDGWSLDDGTRLRADGSRFWASAMISPLHDGADADQAHGAYSLIMRDIGDKRDADRAPAQRRAFATT